MPKYTFSLLLISALAVGCQKNNNVPSDASKVNIAINEPENGQTFHPGDTVYIKASVTYNGQLHGCEVKLTDTTNGFIIYDEAKHVHADRFDISDNWSNDITTATSLRLTVVAYIDHNGTEVKEERYINIKP